MRKLLKLKFSIFDSILKLCTVYTYNIKLIYLGKKFRQYTKLLMCVSFLLKYPSIKAF